jgi:hypothetical protein
MNGYRITLFADQPLPPRLVTDEVLEEVQHMIRLYDDDKPAVRFTLSAVTPLPDTPGAHHA